MVSREQNINGFKRCPICKSLNVLPKTPADKNGMIKRIYAHCDNCGNTSKPRRIIPPIHWKYSGNISIIPIIED